MTWLLTSLSLGLDSLIVSVALAPLVKSNRSRVLLALLFGLFDAIGSLIGIEAGWRLTEDLPTYGAIAMVLLYGLYVLCLAKWGSHNPVSWPVWLMPVLMSFDNLFSGSPSGAGGVPVGWQVLYLGVTSGALALLGLALGRLLAEAQGDRLRLTELGGGLVLASALLIWF